MYRKADSDGSLLVLSKYFALPFLAGDDEAFVLDTRPHPPESGMPHSSLMPPPESDVHTYMLPATDTKPSGCQELKLRVFGFGTQHQQHRRQTEKDGANFTKR